MALIFFYYVILKNVYVMTLNKWSHSVLNKISHYSFYARDNKPKADYISHMQASKRKHFHRQLRGER